MCCFCFFFKQKTAYEMRISDWSSDVCSSDLVEARLCQVGGEPRRGGDAEVGGDQQLLQLLQRLVVQLALGEDAGDALAELGGRAGEHGLQSLTPADLFLLGGVGHAAGDSSWSIGPEPGSGTARESGGNVRTTLGDAGYINK